MQIFEGDFLSNKFDLDFILGILIFLSEKAKYIFYKKHHKMSKIKEKLSSLNREILEKDFLEKLVKRFGYTHKMDDLSNLGYISVIKNGKRYYNNQIKTIKNPYIIGATYMDFKDYMFGGPSLFNKYGFTTQVSNIFTVYNLQYSKEIEILGIKYDFKKVKKKFLYGKDTKMINYHTLYFMNIERCFLEFVRTYATYNDKFFIDSYKLLNKENLVKMMKKYPIKSVLDKVKDIEKCI
ncbi:MAG: hypothetical protein CO170_02585 [candidate division SR1 bacterium CG_4_9_14_3_um_filter_40_9]|nr:MAG: hypothetical protein CO170_02585 [candidate division SR1 bacterium CG_4_9_14_3_um_filter_40_9]